MKTYMHGIKPMAMLIALAFVPTSSIADTALDDTSSTQKPAAKKTVSEAVNAQALPEVAVKAEKRQDNQYQAVTSTIAAKINAPLRDIPQTVNVVTQAVMRDQSALSLQDALRNVPGVGFSNGDGQRDQVTIRGFTAIGDQFVDGIRDDALYFRDLANVEQIEVLKGPAAVLYGRGSSGGIINRVTKKPQDKAFSELTAIAGSYGTARVELDVNQPLGDAAAFRINGAYEDTQTFRDQGFVDRTFIAPSLLLKPSDKTNITFQLEYLDDRRLNDFGIPAVNGKPANVPVKTYYGSSNGSRDDYVQSRVSAGTVVFEHRFNDDIKIRNALRVYQYDLDRNNTVVTSVSNAANPVLGRRYSTIQRQEEGVFNQTDLTINTQGFGLKHALLVGIELAQQNKDAQSGNAVIAPASITL